MNESLKRLKEDAELVLQVWKITVAVIVALLLLGAPIWAFIAFIAWLVLP